MRNIVRKCVQIATGNFFLKDFEISNQSVTFVKKIWIDEKVKEKISKKLDIKC